MRTGRPQATANSLVSEGTFARWVTIGFAVLLTVGVMRHEIWRDEAKAFVIARDSGSVQQLFWNIQSDGHPAGWYLLLFGVTRLTHDPRAMQAMNAAFAIGAVYLLARFAKWPRWQRSVFCLGYFPLFEYGMVSRAYAMGMCLLFAACAVWTRANSPEARVWTVAALLGGLANTSLYGLILAASFFVAIVFEEWKGNSVRRRSNRVSLRHGICPALLLAALMGLSALSILPPMGETQKPLAGDARFAGSHPVRAIGTFWRTIFPVPAVVQRGWRKTGNFDATETLDDQTADVRADPFGGPATPGGTVTAKLVAGAQRTVNRLDILIAAAAVAAFVLLVIRFKVSWTGAIFLISSVGLILLLTGWKFPGGLRHHGHLFLALSVAYWFASHRESIDEELPRQSVLTRAGSILVVLILIAQAAAGVGACAFDIARPFSASRQAAAFVNANYGPDARLIATPGDLLAPICATLDTSGYIASRGEWGSFVTLDGRPKRATAAQLDAAFDQLCQPGGPPVLMLTDLPLDYRPRRAAAREVARFTDTLISERYFIYEITVAAPPGSVPTPQIR